MVYLESNRHELRRAALFSCGMLLLLLAFLMLAFASSGPIVLGTEQNTDGMVEYLCLGRGCESLTAMSW